MASGVACGMRHVYVCGKASASGWRAAAQSTSPLGIGALQWTREARGVRSGATRCSHTLSERRPQLATCNDFCELLFLGFSCRFFCFSNFFYFFFFFYFICFYIFIIFFFLSFFLIYVNAKSKQSQSKLVSAQGLLGVFVWHSVFFRPHT